MKLADVFVGTAVTLSIAAFVLALWPAVADAPWEKQEIAVSVKTQELTPPQMQLFQTEICLRLVEAEPRTVSAIVRGDFVKEFLIAEGRRLGCWE